MRPARELLICMLSILAWNMPVPEAVHQSAMKVTTPKKVSFDSFPLTFLRRVVCSLYIRVHGRKANPASQFLVHESDRAFAKATTARKLRHDLNQREMAQPASVCFHATSKREDSSHTSSFPASCCRDLCAMPSVDKTPPTPGVPQVSPAKDAI